MQAFLGFAKYIGTNSTEFHWAPNYFWEKHSILCEEKFCAALLLERDHGLNMVILF